MRAAITGTNVRIARVATALLAMAVTIACESDSPTAPGPPAANTITITGAGADPRDLRIRVGERVVFGNNDSVDHEMSSDSHPTHLACPQINQVGYLRPGETRETGNFVRPETCSFHDHINPTNVSLTGTITVTE